MDERESRDASAEADENVTFGAPRHRGCEGGDLRETAADDWARDTLVFSDALIAFQARHEKPEPWQIQEFAREVKVHPAIAAEVFNKKAGCEVIKYGYLKLKGLFPHISEVEAEDLWKRNELAV